MRIWISGSKQFPKIAQQITDQLREISVLVDSVEAIPVGRNVSQCVQESIEVAHGIIILLGSAWNGTSASAESPLIAARCSGGADGAALWIVDIEAALMPPGLKGLALVRFPRSGNPLTALPSAKRIEALAALRRSVAARLGLPDPQDTQHHHLEIYRTSQRDRLSELPLKGFFTARHPAAARTFCFTELFVPPRIEWFQLPRDIQGQFQELDARLRDEELRPRERWQIWEERNALAVRYKRGGAFHLDEALSRFPQLMLLGKPGSGKSSILHHLALRTHASGSGFAVLLKLSALADKIRPDDSLWPHILRKVESDHGPIVSAALEERAPEGRALLLLDGVDEVRKEHRPLLVSALERMLLQQKDLRCVVSSRLAADCWLDDRIPHMHVAELNQEEIALFVKQHKKCESPSTAEAQSQRLIKSISSSHALRELAPNPLSLRLLCLLDHGADGLPVDQVDLYERAICTLLETWPANRVARKVNVTPEHLRRALASVAAWMHRRGQRDATRTEWTQQLAAALPRSPARTPEQLAVCCMDAATLYTGILVEASPERFEFLHLTFTEYLAADHYIRQGLLSDLAAQRVDSRYSQVIHFAVAMLKQVHRDADEAGRFLRMFAEPAPGTPERIQYPHLPLVAKCLGSGEGFPQGVVEELFCFILRAARLPLTSTVEAAEGVLKDVQRHASARMIAACGALEEHPVSSLVVAAARFVARNTVDRPDAQALCRRWLTTWEQSVGCHAALGLVRSGQIPDEEASRIVFHLAHVFHKDIAAADEAEQALRENPKLVAAAEALLQNPRSAEAARVLSLIRADDWPLVSLVIDKTSSEDSHAVLRAALRSEQTAQQLVEHYLARVRPRTHPRPGSEAVLHATFADSKAVRSRLLLYYRRPLPEAPSWERRQDPERAKTEAAEAFLKETARSGEERARSRAALLIDLQSILPDADADLCRRIATLVAGIDEASDLLTAALTRCVEAGGTYRVWAIAEAFRQRKYHIAVAGTLARAEAPGCMAAAVFGLRRQFRSGSSLQPLVAALAQQPASPLRDWLLLLCRVTEREAPVEAAHALLKAPLGSVPMPLCWWAAAEADLHARRHGSPLPPELLGPITALASVEWKDPPDLPKASGMGSRQPSWVPKFDTWPEYISWSDEPELPKVHGPQRTAAALQCLAWLRDLALLGAQPRLVLTGHVHWLHEAVAEDLSLFRAIVQDLDHPQSRIQWHAQWTLLDLLAEERLALGPRKGKSAVPSAASKLLLDEFFRLLAAAPQSLGWQMTRFLFERGMGGDRLQEILAAYLSPEYSLSIRWTALTRLPSPEVAGEAGLRVLRDALVAAEPDVRLRAVEYVLNHSLNGLCCAESLLPLLEPSIPPVLQLEAAALWLRMPGSDRHIAVPVLIRLLGTMEPATHLHRYRILGVISHIIGPVPDGEPIPVPASRFEPAGEKAWLAFWAAAILAELGGQDDALRAAAEGWLAAIPPDAGEREPWHGVRHHALSMLVAFGVGSAGALVERVLLRMIEEDGDYPHESLTWIRDLQTLSTPILGRLLPFMLRKRTNEEKKLAEWVLGRAEEDSAVRSAFVAALAAAAKDPQPDVLANTWGFLKLLHQFSLIDDRAAQLFVSAASTMSPGQAGQDWVSDFMARPDVQVCLFAALRTYVPHRRIQLIDRLLPLHLITGPDESKHPRLTQQAHDLLREWLSDADYGLRLEAGERLFRLGYREESVLESLRSCLQAPLDWSGTYYGNGARQEAVRILGALEQISPQERLDALIPVLDAAADFSDVQYTLELLMDVPACHESALSAVVSALQRLHGPSIGYWPVVEAALKLGLPVSARVPVLLRFLSEETHEICEGVAALAAALGTSPGTSEDEGNQASGPGPKRDPRTRLRNGLLEGAFRLAELSRWPDTLLRSLAETMSCSQDALRLLEEEGSSLDSVRVVSLLENLLHTPEQSALATLTRHACLFRFGHLAGLTEGQLAYTLMA